MERIDNFLLDRIFEPIAHKFQIFTGRSNFYLANVFFYFCAIFLVIMAICMLVFVKGEMIGKISLIIVNMFSSYLFLSCCAYAKKKDREFENSRERTMNSDRLEHIILRYALVTCSVMMSCFIIAAMLNSKGYSVIMTLSSIFFLVFFMGIALYFFACTPLPKSESKIREFIKSLKINFMKISELKLRIFQS